MLHTKFKAIGQLVLEKKIFKDFYHVCDHDHFILKYHLIDLEQRSNDDFTLW